MQQLGRGTRKSPDTGKKCLYVFDFVDNAGLYNAALSLHRVVGKKKYRPGELVLAKSSELEEEQSAFGRGEKPHAILELGLHTLDYEEVDLFNWQDAIRGMISAPDLDRELAATEGTVRRAVERGVFSPDHVLPLGKRVYLYFARERIDEIRQSLGLPEVTEETIKKLFFDFVEEMDMSASYKPVLLLSFLDSANARGRARMVDVVAKFREFYEKRAQSGMLVEKPTTRMFRVADLSDAEVQNVIIGMPLSKFQQRRYLDYARDVAWIQFSPSLWRQLSEPDVERVRGVCHASVERYYSRLTVAKNNG